MASQKGQVALEYLVTYGWALLALVIVVALLIASGAFSPGAFSSQECVFQPDLPCSAFILYKNSDEKSTLKFNVANGLGYPIKVTGITYTATDMGERGRHEYGGEQGFDLPSGAVHEFEQEFEGVAQPGIRSTRTVLVGITYQNCRQTPCSGEYATAGRITALAEQG